MIKRAIMSVLILLVSGFSQAEPLTTPGVQKIQIDLFLSSTCPYCHKADDFITALAKQENWIEVRRHIINQDKAALTLFAQEQKKLNQNDFRVPSIFFCNARWVGFESEETTGMELKKALDYCHTQIQKDGKLTEVTSAVLQRYAAPTQYIMPIDSAKGKWNALPVIAWIDAFNPCALFVFAAFFAFTFRQKSPSKQGIMGLILMVELALLHFWQQTDPGFFIYLIPWLRLPSVLMGVVLMTWLYSEIQQKGWIRLGIYPIAIISMALVFVYQQTCVLNWSYFFQQWLVQQELTQTQGVLLQLLYQVVYVSPLMLMLLIFMLINAKKHNKFFKIRLQLICTLYLLLLGVLLLLDPNRMGQLVWSVLSLIPLTLLGWMLARNRLAKLLMREQDTYLN